MTGWNSLFSLEGRAALVTGGTSGIGKHIARGLLSAGAQVIVVSRHAEACEETALRLNEEFKTQRASGLECDITDEQSLDALPSKLRERSDGLAILINAAGKAWGAPLHAFPERGWREVMAVNLSGPFGLIQRLLPQLQARASSGDPARIVNLGSISGSLPIGAHAYSYAASKAAIHHLTRVLARELAPAHVTVNAIAPGVFPSRMTAFGLREDVARERVSQRIPLGRLGSPDDIAAAIIYLCSKGGAYVTGAILPVDGGMSVDCGCNVWQDGDDHA